MNNIYKVIWSKAKNCYVVVSEIARSHTKSASGSEKIGEVARHALLALGAACAIACGGFVNVGAVEYEHVDVQTTGTSTATVYTKNGTESYVDHALTPFDTKTQVDDKIKALKTGDVATNKDNITALQTTTRDHGQKITANTTQIANNTAAIAKKIDTETAEAKLALKANAADVYTKADVNTELAKKADVTALDGKADKSYVDTAVAGAVTTAGTNVNEKLKDYAKTTYVDTEVGKKANKATTLAGYEITDAYTKEEVYNKGEVARELDKKADLTALDQATGKINDQQTAIDKLNEKTKEISYAAGEGTKISGVTIKDGNIVGNGNSAITQLANVGTDKINGKSLAGTTVATATEVEAETLARKEADNKLEEKIAKNTKDIATLDGKVATAEGNITDLKKKDTELEGRIKTNEGDIETNKNAISDINKRTAGIQRIDATKETTIEGNVTVNSLGNVTAEGDVTAKGKLKGEGVDAGDGTITTKGAVNAGSLTVENASNLKGDVTMDKKLSVTGDTSLNKTDVGGALNVTGASDLKGNVTLGTNATNTVTVNGTANFNAAVNMDKGLTVTSGDTTLKDTTVTGDLKVTGTITTDKMIFGEAPNNYTEIDKGKVTSKNLLVVTGTAETISSSSTFNAKKNEVGFANGITDEQSSHKQTSDVITDTVKNNNTGDQSFHKQTSDVIMDNVKDGKNTNNRTQTKTETKDIITDENGNSSTTSQTASENKTYLKDKDGKNTNSTIDTAKGYDKTIKGENGKTSTKQDELNITNTAKDGTITNDANHIVNKANTMDTTVAGKATESYGELETTVNGNETHTVTGSQDIHVTGKQTNTVEGGQENIISGGQTNIITGDQTTTITGNKTETVTENVTEDYKKDLTTTVGGNETHEVKGTKTETVEGKVTENFKNGQETNVTGDQVIKVSGTQTTTATDINRNASSGMIDTIDNDYGTNTETKVAGKTTTDVSIKGTGEEGKYIRGANESRDYLIKGTLKNSETKTVEKTSTEITDGNGKTSATIQDKTQISGSVTNGTSSAVSNVKADSIDTAVIEGTNTSLISQKKDSITSAVGNSTTSTVIQQGDKDITIASNGGTVGIVGKDIINNATNEITNTAGTKITDKVGNNTRVIDQTSITDTVGTASRKIEDGKITDTAGDSTVTTENEKGTTFAKAGSAAYSTGAGAPTDTNIAGNHITTGRVDANELGVSDKDDQGNTADFSVKAGEGIKGSVTDKDGNKTYTTVTATENSFQVQDKDGNIKNHQVNTKDKSENTITNGTKANTVTSTADGTTFNNSKANTVFEGGTYTDTTIKGNTITTGKVTMDYADVMRDLGVRGNATVDKDMTVKGNTTLGEAGKGTTLTVNSKATFNENATFEKGAEVKNGLTVSSGGLNVTGESTFNDKVTMNNGLDVTGGVASDSFTVKGTDIKIDSSGINAGGTVISNVADGSISEGSKDAVNGGQLYQVKNDLEGKVNKVGANAAAMANLHPMEFDPDSKWNIAAAMGNYGSETATAIGAFYRPNEDVMVNFSTAFGTGENMVGGGVSVRLGKGGNKLSREESNALKDQVNDLTARMDALLSVLNPNMSKDFPDVPENHWAYEAVSRLAGNDIVQGYPDGEFHGERTMTRYEMAEIIYNALSRGAEAEKELVEEFKPELQAMAASEKATAERAEG